MTSLLGTEKVTCLPKFVKEDFPLTLSLFGTFFRRESLWPELDQLLRDEDDATTVTTPYTAAISEYRVVFHDSADVAAENENWMNANGHAVHDAQHPFRL